MSALKPLPRDRAGHPQRFSGGVDSSVVTALGHKAIGDQLKTVFIENGLMRQGEPERVVNIFADMGIPVRLVDAKKEFLGALKGLTDPEEKRNAITRTFYSTVFGKLVRETGAKYLLHGTILTDIEETVAGIKRQHNILAQIGIDHWIEHNQSHMAEYKKWAEKAGQLGLESMKTNIQKAIENLHQCNLSLKEALKGL